MPKLQTHGPRPSLRSSPYVVTVEKDFYLFGGLFDNFSNQTNQFYNDLFKFNTRTNTWEQLSPKGDIPSPRAHCVGVYDQAKNRFIVNGGGTYTQDFLTNETFDETWEFNIKKNAWRKIESAGPIPSPRANAHVWLVDRKMYLFGGIGFSMVKPWEFFNDTWVFDLDSDQWTMLIPEKMPDSPTPRDLVNAGQDPSSEGKLILNGGIGGNSVKRLFWTWNDTWEFDLKTHKWKDITPKPEFNISPPRDGGVLATISNNIIIQGGNLAGVGNVPREECLAPFPQRPVTDEIWAFDETKHIWRKITAGEPMPRLKYAGYTVIDDKIYICCGYDYLFFGGTANELLYGKGPGQIWNTDVYYLEPILN